jgi:hypothetical protein
MSSSGSFREKMQTQGMDHIYPFATDLFCIWTNSSSLIPVGREMCVIGMLEMSLLAFSVFMRTFV